MVGREVVFPPRAQDHAVARTPVLEISSLSAQSDIETPALRQVDLSVNAGEIVGVAGVAGNGQRELAEAITGVRPSSGGSVTVAGRRLRSSSPRQAIAAGIAHIPEDRLGTGVAPGLAIWENLVLKSYRQPPLSAAGLLRQGLARRRAGELISRFRIAGTPGTAARLLSGGNLQKVVLARELSSPLRVLIAASPTRGLDVAATESVRGMLLDAARSGVAILLISEDLDEILALSDRIAVLYEGRIMGVLDRDHAQVEEIGLMMAGTGRATGQA